MPHIHEKIDFIADIYIVFENKVLLRMHDKYNIWLPVGGHIELDEDPNQAVIREAKEESGMDVELLDRREFRKDREDYQELIAPMFLNRHRITENHEHIGFVYFGRSKTRELQIPETEENKKASCRWFTREELDRNEEGIREDVAWYAKRALEEIGLV